MQIQARSCWCLRRGRRTNRSPPATRLRIILRPPPPPPPRRWTSATRPRPTWPQTCPVSGPRPPRIRPPPPPDRWTRMRPYRTSRGSGIRRIQASIRIRHTTWIRIRIGSRYYRTPIAPPKTTLFTILRQDIRWKKATCAVFSSGFDLRSRLILKKKLSVIIYIEIVMISITYITHSNVMLIYKKYITLYRS